MGDVQALARDALAQFRKEMEPLQPELYRYCRRLTRSPWDAEDLVQDTLARALVIGSLLEQQITNPRAWLFRVASNLWIDRARRAREEPGEVPESGVTPEPRAAREAAGTLIARLSPQERVAVVLKDAFDLSLEEIAEILGTTPGAVKAALHRGRGKLAADEPEEPRVPPPAALDAFCKAFSAGDLAGVTRLLLDTVTVEMPGTIIDLGLAATTNPRSGILYHTVVSPLSAGVPARYLDGYRPRPPRLEARWHRGRHIVLYWFAHDDGEAVRGLALLDADGDRFSRVRQYTFSPEMVEEVCRELRLPFRSNGHGVVGEH